MDQLVGVLCGVVALFFFAFSDFYLAKSSRRIGSFRAVLWFNVLILCVLLVLGLCFFRLQEISTTTAEIAIVIGVTGIIGYLSFARGLEVGIVSIVSTIGSAWAPIAVILGVLLLSESLTLLEISAICLIIVGTVAISLNVKEITRKGLKRLRRGIAYALVALFCWGIYFFLLKILVDRIGWFPATLFVMPPAVAFVILYGLATKQPMKIGKLDLPFIIIVAVASLTATVAYNVGVSYSYVAIVAPLTGASPAVLVMLALVFLKEKVTTNQKIGIISIILGIIFMAL